MSTVDARHVRCQFGRTGFLKAAPCSTEHVNPIVAPDLASPDCRPRAASLKSCRWATGVAGARRRQRLVARIVEDLGYEAVYVTGAGIANTQLGMPDLGLLTVTELAETTARVSDVCSLPLIVDIDTGFGNALNV